MCQQSSSMVMYSVQLGAQKFAVNRQKWSTDGGMIHAAHTHREKELNNAFVHARAYPPSVPNRARSSFFCGEARNERPSSSVELELQLYRTTRVQVTDQVWKPSQPRTTLISPILRRRLNGTARPWAIRSRTTTGHPHADDHFEPRPSVDDLGTHP